MKGFLGRNYWVLIFGILALSALLEAKSVVRAETATPSHQSKVDSKSAKDASLWRRKMQDLYKALAEITTDTSSEQRFNAPKNRSRIEKNAKKLADLAHDISKKGASPDSDPSVKMIAELFQGETQRAYWALRSGNRSYARNILTHASGFCISCHTRNNSGPSFPALPLEPLATDLYPMEQGRFYAATRQYDRALDLFQKIVNDPSAPIKRPLEWEQAIRYGLSISVRVKNDPDQARALVERVIGSSKAPFFIRQDALKWKESILKWKEEIPRRAMTEEGLRSEAIRLVAQAKELQKYPMDHAADVLYLRATTVIHEWLQKAPDGPSAQDALLMAALCYDVLRPLGQEGLHEIYYEACIKKVPHTPAAETCYRRYEQSTYEGYSGSAGTFLPEDLKRKLEQLENLAHPESAETAPKPVLE